MNNFLRATCTVFIALALAFVVPRAYERLLPVDRFAALALSSSEPKNIGQSIVDCLNAHNRFGVWWDFKSGDYLQAHEDMGGSWSASHYVITGRLGWHFTWAAIIPTEAETLTAYETFGADNSMDRGLFRRELPARIVGSLKRCGVAFGGVYPDALPFDI